jgi:hypothetical protein
MNRALVLLASALVLVSVLNLTCASSVETEDIAGKYIPVSRFGQPAKFGGKNQPRSIADALQSGVMSHPLQASMDLDEHSAVWVSRHEDLNNDNGPQYVSIVETGDQQGSSIETSVGFRSEIIRRDDRIIIATVAADLWGGGRKFVFEFFADSPAPYSCIRVMRRGFPPQSQSATALTSTYAVSPNYYPQIPCSLNPNPVDEVKPLAVDLDPRSNDTILNDEIIIAYRSSNKGLNIGVYDDFPLVFPGVTIAGGNLSLVAAPEASVAAELAALNLADRHSYDITSCDFDGDGIFEVCLAYIKDTTLTVRVFGFSGFSRTTLVQKYIQSFTSAPSGAKLAVAAHYLGRKGNYQDDFVISAFRVPEYYLYIVRMNGTNIIAKKFNSLTMSGSPEDYADDYSVHDLAIGDFDGDGQQEITVSHFGIDCSNCPEISVFHYNDTTGSLSKVHHHTYSTSVEAADYVMEIAVARVAKIFTPLAEQLIVMHKGIRIIDMRPFLTTNPNVDDVDFVFDVKYFAQFSQPHFPEHTHLGVGKVIESNLKIGPPVHSVYNEVRQVLAVINSPPKHRDFLNGNFIEIGNSDGNTLARITRTSDTTKKIGVTQKRAWAVGAGIQTDIGRVSASLSTTYGQNFEKTEESVQTVYYQDVSEVSGDDLLIQLQLSWDVWEYPVKNTYNNATSTTILVMFPRMSPTNPRQPDVVMAWVTARTQKEVRSYHEVDNLFSYSEGSPSDITSASYSQQTRTVNGGASVGITVLLSDLTNAGMSTTSTLAFDASLSVSAGTTIPLVGDFGVKLSITGSYSSDDIRTSEVALLTSTQLDVEYGPGQQYSTLSYNVRPYIYFARNGYLVLDYAVDFTGDSGTVSQWQLLYNKPDLTWNLPWRWARNEYTNEFDVNQWRTKDMFITPRRPTDGQTVTLTVRIRNYSLMDASKNFTVQFYLGDFNDKSNKFGDVVVIDTLDARGDAFFTVTDVYRSDVHCMYGLIDSDNEVDELHETNNVAYAIVGEPIQTPLCGKPISDKFGDAFGGVPKTPQAITPTTSAGINVHASVNLVVVLASVMFMFFLF